MPSSRMRALRSNASRILLGSRPGGSAVSWCTTTLGRTCAMAFLSPSASNTSMTTGSTAISQQNWDQVAWQCRTDNAPSGCNEEGREASADHTARTAEEEAFTHRRRLLGALSHTGLLLMRLSGPSSPSPTFFAETTRSPALQPDFAEGGEPRSALDLLRDA